MPDLPRPAIDPDSARMRRPPWWGQALRTRRCGPAVALACAVLSTACTDRMRPSNDPYSRGGELIAMSGGEGGARYACATCHGARGEGNGYDAPRLAGLPAGYLQKQMQDFADGLRPHAVMRDAARFLDSHERVQVANHYAALPPRALPNVNEEPVAPTTAALYASACESCHGPAASGTAEGPPLGGQPAFYLAQQLQDWQASTRRNDGQHGMLKVAQRLQPEEVRQLSLYLARLPPHPVDPVR